MSIIFFFFKSLYSVHFSIMICNVSGLNILHQRQKSPAKSFPSIFHSKKKNPDSYPQSLCINFDLGELVIVIILDEIREDILFLSLSEACQNRLSLFLLIVFVIVFTLFSRCGGLRFSFTFPFLLVLLTSFLVFSFTTNGSLDMTFLKIRISGKPASM